MPRVPVSRAGLRAWRRRLGRGRRGRPKVSVAIATYNSGPGLDRAVASLRAQSLPAREFEVVFVDDGSTDGTYERLQDLCQEVPNFSVERIPNSGWPGRPRNVATARARGQYVLYMDHDDDLFPQALERMHAFASACDADILLGKEVMYGDGRTPGWPTWQANERRVEVGPAVLHCMTPHKLYRRSFIQDAGLRFPEGPVRLEDQYWNHAAYAAADRIAILADYPCYRWWIHPGNSHRAEVDPQVYLSSYLRSLDPVIALPPGRRRDEMLKRSYVRVVLFRLAAGDSALRQLLRREADTILTLFPPSLDTMLEPVDRARSALLRAKAWAAFDALRDLLDRFTLRMPSASAEWVDGELVVSAAGFVEVRGGAPYPLARRDGRWHLDLQGVTTAQPLPAAATDVEDSLARAWVELSVYGRESGVEWPVPCTGTVEIRDGDVPTLAFSVRGRIDPAVAAMGAPLEAGPWDVMVQFGALGHEVRRRVPVLGMVSTETFAEGRRARAYAAGPGNLAVQVSPTIRSPRA